MRTILLLALLAPGLAAGEADARRAAIRKGFSYLDKHVFALPNASGTPRKQFTAAVVGLCHLMEPRTGKDVVKRVKDYLVAYVDEVERRTKDPEQLPSRHGVATSWNVIQYTWPLSVAGLFFAELYLRGQHKREALATMERIVAILEDAQQSNGGWGHGKINADPKRKRRNPFGIELPKMKGAGGYPNTLVSSSNCVASTLGLLAGVLGKDAVKSVGPARKYYRAAQLGNGSFPYDPSQRSAGFSKTNVGRTAGAIFAMACLGMPHDDHFRRSVGYLDANRGWIAEGHGSPCLNLMHGALASYVLGRKEFDRFQKEYLRQVIEKQNGEGCLSCICGKRAFGVTCDSDERMGGFMVLGQRAYTTALHTFVLLLDRGKLKVLEKGLPRATITPKRRGRR